MSFYSGPQPRHIHVNGDFLPYPATKLIITQYLKTIPSQAWWAWITVGAFLDKDDNIIWSTELFVAHLDVELESDSEEETSDSDEEDLGTTQRSRRFSPGQSSSQTASLLPLIYRLPCLTTTSRIRVSYPDWQRRFIIATPREGKRPSTERRLTTTAPSIIPSPRACPIIPPPHPTHHISWILESNLIHSRSRTLGCLLRPYYRSLG